MTSASRPAPRSSTAAATLLPGLIDCHVHAGDVRALGQALVFGVTTELDMFS